MLQHGFPMLIVYNNNEIKNCMMEDFLQRYNNNHVLAEREILLDFKRRLEKSTTKLLSDYGLPDVKEIQSELERTVDKMMGEIQHYKDLFNTISANEKLNEGQQTAFDTIRAAIDDHENLEERRLFFITAPGGYGKTNLCRKLQIYCKSQGILIRVCLDNTSCNAL
jgi:CRISPR/Cas system-associated endonuclease/helicase Cas3